MKKISSTLLLCLFMGIVANAAPKYWVGPINGNWSNTANWSNTVNGAGGAALPGALDSVVFTNEVNYLVQMDFSPTIRAMTTNGRVTLYTSTPVVMRILGSLYVPYLMTLKDSTSADVPFNVIFDGAARAVGTIYGDWIFEGGVALGNADNSGAMFTAEQGSGVTVISKVDPIISDPYSSEAYFGFKGGRIVFNKNTGHLSANETSLRFSWNTFYRVDGNLDAIIPAATWAGDEFSQPTYSGRLHAPAAIIEIKGNVQKFRIVQPILYCARLVIDLPDLTADFDLAIPDGSRLQSSLEVYNTNNHTVTLLADKSNGSSVEVILGNIGSNSYGGNLAISGDRTSVTLARASAADPGKSFKLTTWKNFSQSGGNFSLQDYNGATGISTLEIRQYLTQTGGTFYTNSTSTQGKFAVAMNNPPYVSGPSGSFNSLRTISMSSGSIDNANHTVTLQINHGIYLINGYEDNANGVLLLTPLSVGRLELIESPLTTSAVNILTVNNPSPDAIKLGGLSSCCAAVPQTTSTNYINGPLRRATNSTSVYLFPVGKGNSFARNIPPGSQSFSKSFQSDSINIIPASNAPSVYQAEYISAGYPNDNVTAPLAKISTAEYWNTSKISGADASVKLFLNNKAVPDATVSDALVAASYVGGHWVAVNGTVLSPGNNTTGSVTSKPLSTLGLFTFGYGDPAKLNPTNTSLFNGLNYKYYEGGYFLMPDFNALVPLKTGNSANFDLGIKRAGVNDSFAIVWEGYINIPSAGPYTFETTSDDGSKLYFNSHYTPSGIPLIDNDSTHPPRTVTGTINVPAAGRYPITITYFENYGAEGLQVYWSGPGIPRQQIPTAAFTDGSTVPAASGLNYKYYEGSFNAIPDFSILTPVKTGTSPNVDISIRPTGVNDNFVFKWDGTIIIPTSGTYTFETLSDDGSKLYLNGNYLLGNDGLHAPTSVTGNITIAAGTYPISITYFEKDGGETMQVYWSGPGITRQVIPDAAFGTGTVTPPAAGNGLSYKYYEGNFNTLPDFSTLTPVKTGNSANADISVRPAGVGDHFAFVWTGTINIPAAGTYTFETISDDGSKIYFNMPYAATANSLVNNDGLHGPTSSTGTVTIPVAGTYPITITFFEKDGGETMQLYWTGPGIARQLIPDLAFGPANTIPGVNISGLNYKYYEVKSDYLPYFTLLSPVRTGTTPNIDISLRTPGVNDDFAFMWTGYIDIPIAGSYTFETVSDDGSRVYFNAPYDVFGSGLVNNEGLHAPTAATGTVNISQAGKYPIIITYFERSGGETMQLYWTGPGITRQLVPDAAFTTTNNAVGVIVMSGNQKGNATAENNTAIKLYPNPFAESFTIGYNHSGSTKSKVTIGLYNLNGKLIVNYQPEHLVAGYNSWLFNIGSRNIAAGVYVAQVYVNGVPVKSMKVVKEKK